MDGPTFVSDQATAKATLSARKSETKPPPGGVRPSRVPVPGNAPPVVSQVIAEPGMPLPPGERADAEYRFGGSVGDVRIHTGSRAAESAAAVQARAYTVGSHIVFAAGEYSPGTDQGRKLLAHELTHVTQQRGASPTSGEADNPLRMGPVHSPQEQAADAAANQLTAVDRITTSPTLLVMRQALPSAAEQEQAAKPEPATLPAASSLSAGGKISFKVEKESPKAPAGPFEVFVSGSFEVEAEIAPKEAAEAREEGAGAEARPAAAPGAGAGEARGGWEFRAGPTHSLSDIKEQGAKAELEHALTDQWPGLLAELRPDKVKAEGEITGAGADLSLGAKWGENPVNYELKLTVIGGKWEEGNLHVLDVGLSRNLEPRPLRIPLGGAEATVTVKGVVTLHVEPNWEEIGIWLAEVGGTTLAAGGAVAGVALGYVAWIGYGLYEMDRSCLQGKARMMGFDFVEGYADELAVATEKTPFGRGDEVALIDRDWQPDFKEAKADYLADRISVFAAGDRARQDGRACAVQGIVEVALDSGLEGWQKIASQHRARYGVDPMSRSQHYKAIMFEQVFRDEPAIGLDLRTPLSV